VSDAEDREALKRALAGVKPLARPRRQALRASAPKPVPVQTRRDERAVLAESIAGPLSVDEALETGIELTYLRDGLSRQVLRRLRRGHWVVQDELDLHGMNRVEAAEQVALRLYELLVADSEGGSKTKLTLARLYENTGAVQKSAALYAEVLQANGDSLAALRGLGRTAETEKHLPAALGYWQRLTKTARAGDLPWYEGSYEVARLTQATGKTQESCAQLQQLKPAIPGLSDADLRQKLDALYKQVCR